MGSDVKDCYAWGVLGCGWVGQAFARSVTGQGGNAWGSARSQESLDGVEASGADPIRFDAGDAAVRPPEFPPCRNLLVALPAGVGPEAIAAAVRSARTDCTLRSIVISSTSLYPEEEGTYREPDAIHRVSPHSGVRVLDVERALEAPGTSFLRAGGLVGPGRPLFRPSAPGRPDRLLVVVHIEDVVRAIHHVASHSLEGAYNLTCPEYRTRGEGLPPGTASERRHGGRWISSEKLRSTGFRFLHPDPLCMPDLHPPATNP